MKKFAVVALVTLGLTGFVYPSSIDAYYGMRLFDKMLRDRSPEYRACDDENWPDIPICNVAARIKAQHERKILAEHPTTK